MRSSFFDVLSMRNATLDSPGELLYDQQIDFGSVMVGYVQHIELLFPSLEMHLPVQGQEAGAEWQ